VTRFRKAFLKDKGIQEAVLLSLATACIGYFNIFLRLDMTELLSILFQECEQQDYEKLCHDNQAGRMVFLLLVATLVRTFLTILSFGAKVPAGLFVPSMAIGASFGRLLGILVQTLYRHYPDLFLFAGCPADAQCITPGIFAFLGAAAALW
jgi:chloride channel 3/4/5